MKKKLLLFLMALLGTAAGARAANVEVNATNFPDETFRNWILAQSYGADGILTDAEIAGVTEINVGIEVVLVSYEFISDLTGIEFFTALKWLICDNNQLTTLDVSKNTALQVLDCSSNPLTTLDVSKNTQLELLFCYDNQLTTLDVSNNMALKYLSCPTNQLTALDVSKNTALEGLDCTYNKLTALDVSKNTALETLECYGNGIRGDAMQTLVNGLCDRSTTWEGFLYVYENESPTGNEMTTLQVAAAKAKNWQVLMNNGEWDWVDYPGVEPVVTLNKSEAILEKGKTMTLKATVSSEIDDKSVTWKSSNTTVATVSNKGKVKGVKAGTAVITCTSKATGESATCQVTVSYVKLDQTEAILEKGKTMTLKATVYPSKSTDQSVTWKSSNTAVATVSSKGKVKGVKAGTATITCTSVATGLSTTCTVTVSYVKLDKSEAILEKGKTMTLTSTVYPSKSTDQSVTWKSSNTTVATVANDGTVTGVKAGTATITCTSVATGLSTTCTVTVSYVKLDQTEAILEKGKTLTLTSTVYPSKSTDQSVTWKSSNTVVATVTSDGTVTGVKAGTATITCTSVATGLSTTCTVTVSYVKLDQSKVTIEKGKSITLTPTVYPSKSTDQSVTWKSSNTAVATVSSTGEVTGVKAGTATITCTSVATGLSTTCKVTVKASASARTIDGDDTELTDIETMEENPAAEEPFDVFDLRGHKVRQRVTSLDGLPAGVYIVNSKKVLKK